jgi:hypothetical protein
MEIIEIGFLDIRFEYTRVKDASFERRLLSSIIENDIQEPLQVVLEEHSERPLLLDGFKRYRCAKKLGMGTVPVAYLGNDVVFGFLSILRRDGTSDISTIEQATLIEELHTRYGLSIYTIANHLGRSPSWVSMRLGIVEEMSSFVRHKIMSGTFPARVYLYVIKGFTRVNKIPEDLINAFVGAVSEKQLSTRDLFILFHGFFDGGSGIRQVILEGDVHWALKLLKSEVQEENKALFMKEQRFIEALKNVGAGVMEIQSHAETIDRTNIYFMQQVNVLSYTIVKHLKSFSTVIKELYDRSGSAGCNSDFIPARDAQEKDSRDAAR